MARRNSLLISFITYFVAISAGTILFVLLKQEGYGVLLVTIIVDVLMTIIVFIVSMKINNSSLYDPYWSVIPPIIVIGWMWWYSAFDTGTYLILFGVMFWAIRLTRNWFIDFKGFSHEDFRYIDFRNKFGKMYWVISLLGIMLFPTAIVLLSLYPVLVVIQQSYNSYTYIMIGVFVMVVGSLISYVADAQRREHKKEYPNKSIRTGLWKYSRHPNYFGEVMFWAGVYIVSFSSGVFVEAALGITAMLLLFNLYSVPKMEQKLLKNKEDYHEVIQNHPRFFIRPKKGTS